MKLINSYLNSLKKVPAVALTIFCVVYIAMNILAGKTIFQNDMIAIDGGIVITWIVIIITDLLTLIYGPKTTISVSIFAIIINLLICLVFYLVSIIPNSNADFTAFNQTIGGTWFIVVASTVAFILSSCLNAFLNYLIGKIFIKNPTGKLAYCFRCYISTVISQFIDNLIFSSLTYMVFAPIFWNGFSWTFIQVLMCALLYAGIELVIEVFISPIAFKIYKYWYKKIHPIDA